MDDGKARLAARPPPGAAQVEPVTARRSLETRWSLLLSLSPGDSESEIES
jgi:hypothetical protein